MPSNARSPHPSAAGLSSSAWERLETILARFETAWRRGERPAIEDYLREHPADDPSEVRALLVELVHVELELRLRAGESARVEQYLERFPGIADNTALVLDLIAAEFTLRWRGGDGPDAEEYQARFPDLAEKFWTRLADIVVQAHAAAEAPTVTAAPADAGDGLPPTRTQRPEAKLPDSSPPTVPRVAGYEILDVLGKGGMGVVYRARQVALGRVVALKMVLHAEYASPEQRDRFRGEAEAIAQLQHPNVVQVYEVGEIGGVPYFSLELCAGGSLAGKLDRKNPWPPTRAAALIELLSRAVEAAHQAGLVHRDLKPGNILLTADGTPKVSDFGLVKRLDQQGQTQSGAIIGTPCYMSPEQARGQAKEVGPAADIYALGTILYELLTGRPPFVAPSDLDIYLQIIADDPLPVRHLRPDVPVDLETICHKCLEKEADDRYASALALAEDLQRFLQSDPISTMSAGGQQWLERWARRLGYELMEEVSRDSIGVVYKARQLSLGRVVGLKTIRYGENATESDQWRLRREAEALANLRHPNIVQVYDVGERNGLMYFSMEFMEGGNLAQKVANEPLRPREAARLIQTIARAIGYSHQRGVLHRNIKTANVLLTADNTPKITNFELAKQLASEDWEPEGQVVGTPSYMAPEQATAQRDKIGPAADIWGLGATLYELLTGQPPFKGTAVTETLYLVVSAEPVPVRRLRPNVPRDLEEICLKCLRKDPAQRYATAEELVDDLRRFWEGEPVAARPVGRVVRVAKWARRRPGVALMLILLAAAVMTGLGGILWQYREALHQRDVATNFAHRADAKAEEAQRETVAAKKARDEAQRQAYFAQIGRASAQLQAKDPVGAVAVLDQISPEHRRSWEYRYLRRCADGTPLVLRGHTSWVTCVCYSPDGLCLASGSEDKTVRIWNSRSGKEMFVLRGHTDRVTSVSYSPDGNYLATASEDRTVRIWHARSGQEAFVLRGHSQGVSSISYSPDGSRLASLSDCTVRIWDTRSGKEALDLGTTGAVFSVSYSPDGSRLACDGADGSVRILDARSRQEPQVLFGHTRPQLSVCYSPDCTHLASASYDKTVRIWNPRSGQETLVLRGHTDAVTSVCYSPDGTRLASASWDKTVRVWDVRTGQDALVLRGDTDMVTSVSYSPDGARLASTSWGDSVHVWDTLTGQQTLVLSGHTQGNTIFLSHAVCHSPDGTRLASASGDGTVRVWDTSSGQEALVLRGHTDGVLSVSYSPDGSHLASAGNDGTVRVWDAGTGQQTLVLRGHTQSASCVCYSPDGTRLASASGDDTVRVWDARSGRQLLVLRIHSRQMAPVSYSPDGSHLASGDEDGTVRVWDARSGQEGLVLRGHTGEVTSVCYSPDGSRLASASEDGSVRIWDARSGQEALVLHGHSGGVYSVRYSPDGTRLASSAQDKTVRVWDARAGQDAVILRGHTGVGSICYSPDVTRLASASEDKTVRVWDTLTGQEMLLLRGHTEAVTLVNYSPDGTRIASASEDKTVRVWNALSGEEMRLLLGHTAGVTSVCYSPNGAHLASASRDKTVRIWDVRSGREAMILRGHTGEVLHVNYSPDGSRIASASEDKTVRIWDARSGREALVLRGHNWPVTYVCYSHDGSWIYSVNDHGEKLAHDAATGKALDHVPLPKSLTDDNAIAEGRWVTLVDNGVIRLWPRRVPPGGYNPWAEDHARREAWAPAWHAEDAATAEKSGIWFSAAFHRRRLAQLRPQDTDNRLRLARACGRLERYQEELDNYSRVLAQQPALAPIYLERARIRLALGDQQGTNSDTLAALALASSTRVGWLDFAEAEDEQGDAAAERGDWTTARAHFGLAALWRPGRPDYLADLAWAALAAGDITAYRRECRRLWALPRDGTDLRPLYQLSSSLAGGLAMPPQNGAAAGLLATEAVLSRLGADRRAYAVRTATLSPDNGLDPQELVSMARAAMTVLPLDSGIQDSGIHAQLGKALYRAGRSEEAIKQLQEAIKLQGEGGSTSMKLFLALAYQRRGKIEEARAWRDKAQLTGEANWSERLIHRQLSGEFDATAPARR